MDEVQICNLALSELGVNSITILSDSSKEARECKLKYPVIRDAVLRAHDWGFAERTVALGLTLTTPVGYTYAYAQPSNCLKIRHIYRTPKGSVPIQYKKQTVDTLDSTEIWTDEEEAKLVYTAKITAPSAFDSLFIEALMYRLAASMAMKLTSSLSIRSAMFNSYAVLLPGAETQDALEDEETDETDNAFCEARE